MTRRLRTALLVATALLLAGCSAGVAVQSSPRTTAPAPTCQPDPAKVIAALQPGATFHGQGCYTTHGIVVPTDVTIQGGTYVDPDNTVPPDTGHGQPSLAPVFKLLYDHNVTIENVTIEGTDTSGFHETLVGQAAIDVLSSTNTNLTDVAVKDVYGDGLEVWFATPGDPPSKNLFVTNYSVSGAGRWSFDPSFVDNAQFTNVTGRTWDMESDLPTVGTGPIQVDGCTLDGLLAVQELVRGYITFNHCTGSAQITITPVGPNHGSQASSGIVAIIQSTIATPANSFGYPPSGVYVRGANVALWRDTFTRSPSTKYVNKKPVVEGRAYYCQSGVLAMAETTFTKPGGGAGGDCQVEESK